MAYSGKLRGEAAESRHPGEADYRVRPLGTMERLLQLLSIDRSRDFCVAAEIVTDLAWGNFRAALDQVQRRHALLRVEIREDRGAGAAFYNVDRPIALEFKPLSAGDGWKRVVEDELANPLNGMSGPLMRATVLVQAQRAQIVLIFHHTIADGVAAAIVIRDLMAALSGGKLAPLPTPISLEDIHAKRPSFRMVDTADGPQVKPNASQMPAMLPEFESEQAIVSTLEISKVLTDQIRAAARANATTVYGAICAALSLSARGEKGSEGYGIMTPINVRETFELRPDQFGLYQAMAHVRMPVHTGMSFWDLARHMTSSLAYSRSAEGVSASIEMVASRLPANVSKDAANGIFGSTRYDAIVSNLGVLPIPEAIGRIRLAAFWGPMFPGRFKRQTVIGAATIGDQLRIVQTGPLYLSPVLEQMHDRLQEAVALTARLLPDD